MQSKKAQCGRRYKGKGTIPSLKRKLDRIFSDYIRLRDSKDGICYCITCGRPVPWKSRECHCGHFMNRGRLSTRYHEKNCHAQCMTCNSFAEGEQYKYGKEINKRYGEGTAEELTVLSKVKSKLGADWYEETIREYKDRLKALKKEKL